MRALLAVLLCATAACSNVLALNGTAIFITVTAPEGTTVDELSFVGRLDDGTAVFGPERRGSPPLALPQSLRVLLKDGVYAGQRVRVKVDGWANGSAAWTGTVEATVNDGLEARVELALEPACVGTDSGCTPCLGREDCNTSAPVCSQDIPGGACVECLARADCANPTRPLCDVASKKCVACGPSHACAPTESCVATGQCLQVPDTCADAPALVFSGGGTTATVSLAPNLANDSYQATCTATVGRDVVYKLSLAQRRDVRFKLERTGGSGGAPILYVRPACEQAMDTFCTDNALELAAGGATLYDAFPGEYFVIIEHSTSDEAIYSLTVTLAEPSSEPVNDDCAGAQALTFSTQPDGTLGTSVQGNTGLADNSNTSVDPPSCSPEAAMAGKDVVYSFELKGAQDVSITARASTTESPLFQPVLYLRPSTSCVTGAVELSCAPPVPVGEPSRLILCNLPPGAYSLFVDGAGTAGKFQLDVKLLGPTTSSAADVCGAGPVLEEGKVLCGSNASSFMSLYSNDYTGTDLYAGVCSAGKTWDGPDVGYRIDSSPLLGNTPYRVTVTPESKLNLALFRAQSGCKSGTCEQMVDAKGGGGIEQLEFTVNAEKRPLELVVDSDRSTATGNFLILLEKAQP